MLKGTPLNKRNSTWHKRHVTRRSKRNIIRSNHILARNLVVAQSLKMRRELNERIDKRNKVGLFERYWTSFKNFLQRLFGKTRLA